MDLFKEVASVAMAGANLPPGCSVDDLPGNTREDKKRDEIEPLVVSVGDAIEEAIEHVTYFVDFLEFDGEDKDAVKEKVLKAIFDEAEKRI